MQGSQNGSSRPHLNPVGIDDMAFYLPAIYLPIQTLAEARDLEYDKLNKGLGLASMSVADVGEDAATMAANAARQLIERNGLDPRRIGRIYLGTESALDGSKPTATYVLDMLGQYFGPEYGPDSFLHCDVVDLTFACIGAVDALQNSLDWIRAKPGRMAIVIGSDNAKYELGSGGEYTQGAGAVALLVKSQPRLLALGDAWGVATRPVHDFFKPLRKVSKKGLLEEVLDFLGQDKSLAQNILGNLSGSIEVKGVLDSNEEELTFHKETPVFDGPYSNDCYRERIAEAMDHFIAEAGLSAERPVSDRWAQMVFHLPYAFQARRMYPEIFRREALRRGNWKEFLAENGLNEPAASDFEDDAAFRKAQGAFLRSVSKTRAYREMVAEKIAPGEKASSEVGNLYTSSLFLSLMSSLEDSLEKGIDLSGELVGCFAYGSGSKSKVFEARVMPQWQSMVAQWDLMDALTERQEIDYPTYEAIHRGSLPDNAGHRSGRFLLSRIETDNPNFLGARRYAWHAEVKKEQLQFDRQK